MNLLLYKFGVTRPEPSAPHQVSRNESRNRLQKPPRGLKPKVYPARKLLDASPAQSCLPLIGDNGFTANSQKDLGAQELEEKMRLENETEKRNHVALLLQHVAPETTEEMKPEIEKRKHVGFFLQHIASQTTEDLASLYSEDHSSEDLAEIPESPRRRRPKTPVYVIGQLERASTILLEDRARTLAEEYQSLLASRTSTPFFDCLSEAPKSTTKTTPAPAPAPKKLRKIKCQLSLRDLVRDQASPPPTASSTTSSDSDTLVGSESSTPQLSPIRGEFNSLKPSFFDEDKDSHVTDNCAMPAMDDIRIKIYADLLTNELATALYRQHPAESNDRASGLQILLMIEAYEIAQQRVRKQINDSHMTGINVDHAKSVDQILSHWIQVLYSVYDQSQVMNNGFESVEELDRIPEERRLSLIEKKEDLDRMCASNNGSWPLEIR